MSSLSYKPSYPTNKYGYQNGTFGFGFRGGMFPSVLNGPFGSVDFPLPNTEQKMVSQGPKFNSAYGQYPKYNEETFLWRSGNYTRPFGQMGPVSSFNLKN